MAASPSLTFHPEDILGALSEVEGKHAPSVLFGRGDLDLLRGTVRVSIVGARRATDPGRQRATNLTKALVDADVVVVSGLAAGIDHAAHASAIRFGGRTVAVLGTPLDRAYPEENHELQDLIGREHLLVSQWAAGRDAGKGRSPPGTGPWRSSLTPP